MTKIIVTFIEFSILFKIILQFNAIYDNPNYKPKLIDEVYIGGWEILQGSIITVRLFFLMKNFTQFRSVIKMFGQVTINITKYMIVWAVVLTLFTFFFIIMGVQACDTDYCTGEHDDYKEIHKLMAVFFQTLRNGVGDLASPIYDQYALLLRPDRYGDSITQKNSASEKEL